MNNREGRKSYLSIFEEISKVRATPEGQNGHPYPGLSSGESEEEEPGYEDESYALTDEIDHEVLMHRDAHFGGDFDVMLAYYQEESVGIHPDFDIERISYLSEVEKQLGQDLAPLLLTGAEAEQVARARRAYEKLKEIYEIEEDQEKSPFPRLIADLILSESEDPEEEIKAVVSHGTRLVPELLEIVKSDDAYNPLFPGYGYAPYLAIACLGKIKDPSSVIPLFETLGREMVFDEEIVLEALAEIGEPAKRFLLDIIKGRPITKDTINAAFALTVFANQSEVAIASFEQLQDHEVRERPLLRSYFLYNCEGIQGTPYEEALSKMVNDPELPSDFRKEIEEMLREWK
ncbi:MAG: hypothetical protein JJU12_02850 [Chlamydiales bacterium]|nr:hypothetical protein [Chlamydiales bacterium]